MNRTPLSQEQKDRMAAGRRAKAAERAEQRAARMSALSAQDGTHEISHEIAHEIESPSQFDPEIETMVAEGLLTREEVQQIRVDAAAKVIAEQKAAAKKTLSAKFLDRERREAGLIPPETEHQRWLDEMVEVYVALPKLKGATTVDPIIIDQVVYTPGRMYSVRRAVAMDLISMMGAAQVHHAQTLGESRAFYSGDRMMMMGGFAAGSVN